MLFYILWPCTHAGTLFICSRLFFHLFVTNRKCKAIDTTHFELRIVSGFGVFFLISSQFCFFFVQHNISVPIASAFKICLFRQSFAAYTLQNKTQMISFTFNFLPANDCIKNTHIYLFVYLFLIFFFCAFLISLQNESENRLRQRFCYAAVEYNDVFFFPSSFIYPFFLHRLLVLLDGIILLVCIYENLCLATV